MKFGLKKKFWTSSSSQFPAKKFIVFVYLSCYFVTTLPLAYFLFKNYLVLDEIGFKFFPTLLDINSQDKFAILILGLISFIAGLTIQIYAHNVFLKKIYGPIDQLQSHMAGLIQGEFDQQKIALKQDQYVYELIKTYNYLYSSLQTNLKRDIAFLKELEENQQSSFNTNLILNEKIQQLRLNQEPKKKSKYSFLRSV